MIWKWDKDGATKVLFPDEKCECYFSMSFPEKVIPKADGHFLLHKLQMEIVTLPLTDFLQKDFSHANSEAILRHHLAYELDYLKKVVGKDRLTLTKDKWQRDTSTLLWQIKRHSKAGTSILVSTSVVKDDCVVYLSSIVPDEATGDLISQSMLEIIKSLKSHRPSSKKEAERLIDDYAGG